MYFDINRMTQRSGRESRRGFLCLLALTVFAALSGCGGGSGGGGGTTGIPTSVTGRILRAENGAVEAGTTIKIGGQSTTSASDGTFTFANVDANTKTATITPAAPAKPRTLALSLTAHIANNLGDVFVSDTSYDASVSGTVVGQVNGAQQVVGGATVTIAGTQTKTGTDGKFTISNLPVGLGTDPNASIGTISASNFESKPIFTQFALAAGTNDLGTLLLGAPVSTTPPSLPYTITGSVTAGGKPAANIDVTIAAGSGGQLLGQTRTDQNGNYFFWVVAAQYTITATVNNNTQNALANLQSLDTPLTVPAINF